MSDTQDFLDYIKVAMVPYWENLPDKTVRERLDGLAFSILVALDGHAAGCLGREHLEPAALLHEDYYAEERAQNEAKRATNQQGDGHA